jgi:hypothetical protein
VKAALEWPCFVWKMQRNVPNQFRLSFEPSFIPKNWTVLTDILKRQPFRVSLNHFFTKNLKNTEYLQAKFLGACERKASHFEAALARNTFLVRMKSGRVKPRPAFFNLEQKSSDGIPIKFYAHQIRDS